MKPSDQNNNSNKNDYGGYSISKERIEEIWNLPGAAEWRNLCEKINSGTASPEEIAKYEYEVLPIREMDPTVLYADMPHAEFDKMMREKHAKRIAEEANAQQPEK